MLKIFSVKGVPTLKWSSSTPFNLRPKALTFIYLNLGLVLFGLGEALLISSGAGVSPWIVLSQGIALKTGWSIGFTTMIISFCVLALWIPLKQKPGMGTILNALIIAFMIDFSLVLLPYPQQVIGQIAQATLGVLVVGLASGIYLTANLGTGPRDGLMTGLQAKTGAPIASIRIAIEITVVTIGWYLGGVVGAGTLLFAFGIGPAVAIGILLVRKFL
ncbi:MAG: YitT family protein [Gammaproteobacteria bacterium]